MNFRTFLTAICFTFFCQTFLLAQNYTLDYDGVNDYVKGPTSRALELNEGTVELWLKPRAKAGRQTFICYRSDDGFKTRYLWNFVDGLSGLGSWNGYSYEIRHYIFNPDEWMHLAFVDYNYGTDVFMNGHYFTSFANQFGGHAGSDMHLIFGVDIPWNEYFDGLIDEVRIWNYPRTDEQIQENYDRRANALEPGLVAYYNFDEGTGSQTFDQVSGGGAVLGAGNTAQMPSWVQSDLTLLPALCVGEGNDVDGDGICESLDCNDRSGQINYGPGVACDDGNPLTSNDIVDEDCNCVGQSNTCEVSTIRNPSIKVKGLYIGGVKMKTHKAIDVSGPLSISYYGEYPATELGPVYAAVFVDENLDGLFDYRILELIATDPDPLSPTAGQVFNSGGIDLSGVEHGMLRVLMRKGTPSEPCGDLGNAHYADYYIGAYDGTFHDTDFNESIFRGVRSDKLKVSPNPARDFTIIGFPNDAGTSANLKIYNTVGRLMIDKDMPMDIKESRVDLSALTSGSYLLVFQDDAHKHLKRFVVVR